MKPRELVAKHGGRAPEVYLQCVLGCGEVFDGAVLDAELEAPDRTDRACPKCGASAAIGRVYTNRDLFDSPRAPSDPRPRFDDGPDDDEVAVPW